MQINTWPGWECVRVLGKGSFGKVYEIRRFENGQIYKAALKVISIPQYPDEIEDAYREGFSKKEIAEYFKSFVNDTVENIRLISSLREHTTIVSYEDYMVIEHENEIGWDILIRMELLTPLLEWEREHLVDEKSVIKLGSDICQALEVCHKKKIIHHDVKPGNIFVNKNGTFKLGDFGIARIVKESMHGMPMKGAISHMAPEIYKGLGYNETVDLYSLGLVLYRFLNYGRMPFLPMAEVKYIDSQYAIERRLSGEEIPAPMNGSIQLKRVVLEVLQYEPYKRVQSAAKFRELLESCQSFRNIPYPYNYVEDIFTATIYDSPNITSFKKNENYINEVYGAPQFMESKKHMGLVYASPEVLEFPKNKEESKENFLSKIINKFKEKR